MLINLDWSLLKVCSAARLDASYILVENAKGRWGASFCDELGTFFGATWDKKVLVDLINHPHPTQIRSEKTT